MNGAEHTSVQITLFEKIFCSSSVHVTSVSALKTCCGDFSKTLLHIFSHNLPTNHQLMIDILHI